MFYDIIIIGGGAAGLMAACSAADSGASAATATPSGAARKILVLEKMPRPGRKIMITGKGRCNFTNVKSWSDFSIHVHPKAAFLRPAFYNFPPEKVMEFFETEGVPSVVERGDRAFPASHVSADIVDALLRAARRRSVEVRCNVCVEEVRTSGEGNSGFIVCTSSGTYECSKLLIATGGLSYPSTGSTGDGFGFATVLSHHVRPLFPSLTALVPKGYKVDSASRLPGEPRHIHRETALSEAGSMLLGQSLKNVRLSLWIDGCLSQSDEGDIDFTDGGLEGPLGFRLSRKAVCALVNGSNVTLEVDLKPAVPLEELKSRISTLWNEIAADPRSRGRSADVLYKVLLGKVLPREMVSAFAVWAPDVTFRTLAAALKSWRMPLAGYVGYERCVVTAGGVDCADVNPKTLESKLIPGLYFAGEVLDIDGDTGGYNLQIAFCTGFLAGKSMGN